MSKKILLGDKPLWAILALLSIFSFLPVFSASTNLVYIVGKGTPWEYLFKHSFITLLGFIVMFGVHKIPYYYFKGLSILLLPITFILLIYTAFQGNTIEGANASRWIQIPFIGISFQTSTLASIVLITYLSWYLSKNQKQFLSFKKSILPLWIPVFITIIFILPSNFSTAALIFFMVLLICFLGGYPMKYLSLIIGAGIVSTLFFILIAKSFPNRLPNRVDTWSARIESYFVSDNNTSSHQKYQIERAKIAIASGGIFGLGAGKSVMKNFLPQSYSDFIYSIIVEEYGLLGGLILITLYILLFSRIFVIAYKARTAFGKLLVIGIGTSIILQAFVNIGVAVEILPVTGQTLPLISSGGTSVLMTCIAMGIILSVSVANKETEKYDISEQNNQNPLVILSETL